MGLACRFQSAGASVGETDSKLDHALAPNSLAKVPGHAVPRSKVGSSDGGTFGEKGCRSAPEFTVLKPSPCW
jgi:hypothetical protein